MNPPRLFFMLAVLLSVILPTRPWASAFASPAVILPAAMACNGGRDVCAPEGRDFPPDMVDLCLSSGGGEVCRTRRWDRSFYKGLLASCVASKGLELCADVPCGQGAEDDICTSDLGSFPFEIIRLCLNEGGGNSVCYSGKYKRDFYRGLLTRCLELHDAEKCLSKASMRFGKETYPTINKWQEPWNGFVEKAIDAPTNSKLLNNAFVPEADLIDPAGAKMCPGFYTATDAQKKAFWVAVIASIARWESDFDPKVNNPTDPGGGSWGLLQLSYQVGRYNEYKPCSISSALSNITDPQVNLECGVSVLRRQLERRGRILHTPAERFYWRVLEVYGEGAFKPYVPNSFARIRAQMPFCTL